MEPMLRIASCAALVAVLMLVIDPFWCEDGCTDRPANHAGVVTDCTACQRSVPPASTVAPVVAASASVARAVEPFVAHFPESWYPDLEHPPRLA